MTWWSAMVWGIIRFWYLASLGYRESSCVRLWWLLLISAAKLGLREHLTWFLAACRFPKGRVESKCQYLLIFKRGIVHRAVYCHLHEAINKHLLSVVPSPPRRLDKTIHHLFRIGDDN